MLIIYIHSIENARPIYINLIVSSYGYKAFELSRSRSPRRLAMLLLIIKSWMTLDVLPDNVGERPL